MFAVGDSVSDSGSGYGPDLRRMLELDTGNGNSVGNNPRNDGVGNDLSFPALFLMFVPSLSWQIKRRFPLEKCASRKDLLFPAGPLASVQHNGGWSCTNGGPTSDPNDPAHPMPGESRCIGYL